jgi:hypothetical protein
MKCVPAIPGGPAGTRGTAAVLLLLLTVLAPGLGPARALGQALSPEQRSAVLAEAQAAYDDGVAAQRRDPEQARRRFEASAERYAMLVEDGVENGRLRYNLANAQLQSGRLGEAVLNYRRAERLIPGDPRLRSNLSYARSLVRSRIEPGGGRALLDALLAWHRRTTTAVRLGVFVLAYLALWPTLLLVAWRAQPPVLWRGAAVGCAAVALVTGISVGNDLWLGEDRPAGVLMSDEVVLRKGNGEGYEPRFEQPLHEGVEFELIEQRGSWLNIELSDGSTGWVRAAQAELVRTASS